MMIDVLYKWGRSPCYDEYNSKRLQQSKWGNEVTENDKLRLFLPRSHSHCFNFRLLACMSCNLNPQPYLSEPHNHPSSVLLPFLNNRDRKKKTLPPTYQAQMYESGCLTSFLLPPLRPFLINKEKARALTLFFFLANPILHTWPSFFFCLINFCTAFLMDPISRPRGGRFSLSAEWSQLNPI